MRRFLREFLADADRGESVENPEFALPKALVDDQLDGTVQTAGGTDRLRGLTCADIGRRKNDFRAFLLGESGEPLASRPCLKMAKIR